MTAYQDSWRPRDCENVAPTHLSKSLKLVAAAFVLLSLGACKGRNDPLVVAEKAQVFEIKVLFDRKGCPINTQLENSLNPRVKYPVLKSGRDSIFWQAYDKNGVKKQDTTFALYFSPFRKGGFVETQPNSGATKPLKVSSKDVPTNRLGDPIEYKYTIWARETCPDAPLDPRFKVL